MKKTMIAVLLITAFTLLTKGLVMAASDDKIEEGKLVKIHYTLAVDGEVVDSSSGKEPLAYTQGKGMIIPGLESQLKGLRVGDKKQVIVGPDDAYGVVNPNAVLRVPKTNLPEGGDFVGAVLSMNQPTGETLKGIVKEITETEAVVDFNHPLAGRELHFDVEVVEIT